MNTALLLIALGFGYKIFIEARQNTKKSMKRLGRIIGVFIMVMAFLGSLCSVFSRIHYAKGSCGYSCSYHGGYAGKGISKGKFFCPFTGKAINDKTDAASG